MKHYGTVNCDGMKAYKVGNSPTDRAKAEREGYRMIGNGRSYLYYSKGDPHQYRTPQEAAKHAQEFRMTQTETGTTIFEFYNHLGTIHKTERQCPDPAAAAECLKSKGLRQRQ